jgi:hypothetical protein
MQFASKKLVSVSLNTVSELYSLLHFTCVHGGGLVALSPSCLKMTNDFFITLVWEGRS